MGPGALGPGSKERNGPRAQGPRVGPNQFFGVKSLGKNDKKLGKNWKHGKKMKIEQWYPMVP